MSRIAKDPVNIPESVNLTTEGKTVNFKGPKGEMSLNIHESIDFSIEDNMFQVKWSQDEERAMAGTMRALVNNYVKGVSEGFEKKVKLNGVGYRAAVQGKSIVLNLGYSHPVEMEIPEGISIEVQKNTQINLKACDKEQLGLFAAKMRAWRPPEP